MDGHPRSSNRRARRLVSVPDLEREPKAAPERAPDTPVVPGVEKLTGRIHELERQRNGLEDFAARAAHELLSPLIMTEAYVGMVAAQLEPETHGQAVQDLDAINRTVARARRLVETLLHEAGTPDRPLLREPVELAEVVEDCVTTLAPEIQARGAEVRVQDLPTVRGNRALLWSVFMNLLVNALRYSARERCHVNVWAARHGSDAWRISVDSPGRPIADEDRGRIFGPYERGQEERRVRGAGLGLAICRRIVERHGGLIGVLPGENGNQFWFTLPAD